MTNSVPKEEGIDHSLNLLREGYLYILNRRQSFHSDLFETRLLGKKAVCMGGKEAADLFYDNSKFKRAGVAPNRVAETLFGKKGVQTLDGDAHKHRKKMFMSIMSQDRLKKLNEIAAKQWDTALTKWQQMDDIVLYEEALEIMCRTACEWAGVPVEEEDMKKLADDLRAMFESATAIGPSHWAGRHARNRVEKWMGNIIDQVREEKLNPEEGTALYTFAWHRDLEGNLLDQEVASVEVINILKADCSDWGLYYFFCIGCPSLSGRAKETSIWRRKKCTDVCTGGAPFLSILSVCRCRSKSRFYMEGLYV